MTHIKQASVRQRSAHRMQVATLGTLLLMATSAAANDQGSGPGADHAGVGPVTPMIIGGAAVPDGKYPFVGSIVARLPDGTEGGGCGASLLTPLIVLTAAHCVDDLIGGAHPEVNYAVVFDRADLRHVKKGQRVPVALNKRGARKIFLHPNWDSEGEGFEYDVALLVLEHPVVGIEPVVLPSPGSDVFERPGTQATVAGWGNMSPYTGVSDFPYRLREVRVPVVSPRECRYAYDLDYDEESMLCAGRTMRDSCAGDSGGPLFLPLAGERAVVQIGVVSFGNGCGKTGSPGIYTRLSSPEIQEWMEFYTGR